MNIGPPNYRSSGAPGRDQFRSNTSLEMVCPTFIRDHLGLSADWTSSETISTEVSLDILLQTNIVFETKACTHSSSDEHSV